MSSVYAINPNNFQVTMMPTIHPPAIVFPLNENKHDQLAPHLYSSYEKNIQSVCHKNLEKELHNLRKYFDEELRLRNCQSLKYENLCVHPNVELPLGLALSWYTKQDFSKWHIWEDMGRDFVKKYEFNNGDELRIADLLKLKKLSQELISTFIHVKEGLYYEKLLGTCAHNFSDLIKVGKEIENDILGGRILSNSVAKVVHQTFQAKIPANLQSKMRENNSFFMTMQQPQY
ncbi:hypothetical protein H5410_063882 [Solanum commersonii]|uniref:Retrotransposon gag domain-containing protein n=1 Tax=Solanum commersonii TaxID=4109 RepID=A0A9J5WFV6_SOLCO|nr:hypothetical protein H5410_063882 [Solanum commersonii]